MESKLSMVGKGVFIVDVHNKEGEVSIDCALGYMVVRIGDVVTGGVYGIDNNILVDEVNGVTGLLDGVDAIDDMVAIKVDDHTG